MKKTLKYQPPILRSNLSIAGLMCGPGSTASAGQGLCEPGTNTLNTASGDCGDGFGVGLPEMCGSGTNATDPAGETGLCFSGTGVAGTVDSLCASGTAASGGDEGNCIEGGSPA